MTDTLPENIDAESVKPLVASFRTSLQRIRDEVRRAEVPTTQVRKALASQDEVRRALTGNFGNEVFDSLVDPYTNRHGVVLKARRCMRAIRPRRAPPRP